VDMNYDQFGTIDFAVDEAFIQHYLFPSTKSSDFWKNWLSTNPSKSAEWEEARKLIEAVQLGLSDYARTFLSEEAEAALLERIINTNHILKLTSENTASFWKHSPARVIAAACIVLMLCVGGLWILKDANPVNSPYTQHLSTLKSEVFERVNKSDKTEIYYLSDSTRVVLYPASRLSFTRDYGKENRTVYLSGKAVFDVSKDPLKPFFVYANEIVTKVLGTQFEVSAFEEDRDVIVKVQSGQVSVYRNKESSEVADVNSERSGVLLLPNQQVVFKRQTEQFNKNLIEKPSILPAFEQQPFAYEETPVVQVLEDIEKSYGVDLVYNNEMLKNCELTASLMDESLLEKLDIICRSIGATYETVDAQIIINSKGCKSE